MIGKIKQNELDCRDTAPLTALKNVSAHVHLPNALKNTGQKRKNDAYSAVSQATGSLQNMN